MMLITKENLLSVIQPYLPKNPIILEAGAFNGKDTYAMAHYWPEATIHSFEPVPEIFTILCMQTQQCTNVHCYPLALSNKSGVASFFNAQYLHKPNKLCPAGSLLAPKERLLHSSIIYPKTISVPTIALDEWATLYSIGHLDFIWLDLQGHELAVLQAGTEILKSVTLLYVEVNFIEAYHEQPPADTIKEWLTTQGFYPIAQDFTDKKKFFGNILFKKQ